jgi:hypothetical protein
MSVRLPTPGTVLISVAVVIAIALAVAFTINQLVERGLI